MLRPALSVSLWRAPSSRGRGVEGGDGQTQSYTFDPMGNRTQKADSVSGTENYTYNNANMLLTRGANNYTNDLAGNTLTGGGRTNTWDSQNRLAQCVYNGTTSTFTYAADGIRHRSVVGANTTDYVLDSSMFVREKLNGAVSATYLVGARGPEYRRNDSTGAVRWYCFDGLGSVLGEVDTNGTVTASRTYDVYGLVRSSAGTSTSKHKFVGSLGHPSEDETGLVYMRARSFDPVIGRFESEDSAHDGQNWFTYCSANPVNQADGTGKCGDWVTFLLLLEKWTQALEISEIFRVSALGSLEGWNVFTLMMEGFQGASGRPSLDRQAYKSLVATYDATCAEAVRVASYEETIRGEMMGYTVVTELWAWFLTGDDVNAGL